MHIICVRTRPEQHLTTSTFEQHSCWRVAASGKSTCRVPLKTALDGCMRVLALILQRSRWNCKAAIGGMLLVSGVMPLTRLNNASECMTINSSSGVCLLCNGQQNRGLQALRTFRADDWIGCTRSQRCPQQKAGKIEARSLLYGSNVSPCVRLWCCGDRSRIWESAR
jgi:hypothetical protein